MSTSDGPAFFVHAIHASMPAFCISGVDDFIICSNACCDALYSTRNFFMAAAYPRSCPRAIGSASRLCTMRA
jgi:hypothetical protein